MVKYPVTVCVEVNGRVIGTERLQISAADTVDITVHVRGGPEAEERERREAEDRVRNGVLIVEDGFDGKP